MSGETYQPKTATTEESVVAAARNPTPLWLIGLLALLGYGGMIYLDSHGGGFSPKVFQPFESARQLDEYPRFQDPLKKKIANGKKVFETYCAVCHQNSGIGSATTGCPPLDGSEWVVAEGPNRIIRIVLNGLTGPITVKGAQYGLAGNVMTPFKGSDVKGSGGGLTDEQISDVLTYIRQAWGNKAGQVADEQVTKIRAKVQEKAENWKPADLLQIPDKD